MTSLLNRSWLSETMIIAMIIVSVVFFLLYLFLLYDRKRDTKKSIIFFSVFIPFATFVIGVSAIETLFVSYKKDGLIPVVRNEDGLRVAKYNNLVFRGDVILYLPVNLIITSSVKPITNNPKVRDLTYHLNVEVQQPEIFFKQNIETNDKDVGKKISRLVEYQLYEFNNAHSKELAGFYNPLDSVQHAKLGLMINEYINPLIKPSGLWVKLNSFEVK